MKKFGKFMLLFSILVVTTVIEFYVMVTYVTPWLWVAFFFAKICGDFALCDYFYPEDNEITNK